MEVEEMLINSCRSKLVTVFDEAQLILTQTQTGNAEDSAWLEAGTAKLMQSILCNFLLQGSTYLQNRSSATTSSVLPSSPPALVLAI